MPNNILKLHLFGHLRLMQDGQLLKFTALPKSGQLLAYLLLHADTAVPRDHLAFLLWDDVSESEARANLRRHLHDLRRALPPDNEWLVSQLKAVQWNLAAPYWVDVTAFRQLCQQPAHQAEAIALYTGDLLTDFYADWLVPHRERLQEMFFSTITDLISRARQQQDLPQAMALARQLLTHDPLREDVVRDLMLLRQESGDRAGALQLYQQFEVRLDTELGVPPMPETTAVYQTILITTESPPPAPPTPTLPRHNLPTLPISFVGRQEEIAYIQQVFSQAHSTTRLLNITGPGGSGKTRLAIEAGTRLAQQEPPFFADGIFLVRLVELTAPEQIDTAVVQTLNLRPENNQNVADTLLAYLRDKQLLLILDNFEHLLPAAARISEWLAAAPGLRLLITSQTLLYLYGEHELPLAPLPLPHASQTATVTELLTYPAIALFVDRARAARSDFVLTEANATAVTDICASLDGLPLAIELAAARSKLFTPQAMRDQLRQRLTFLTGQTRDLSARQRTMRATVEWSYNLLDAQEQAVFCQLCVFTGSFTLAMAESVLGTAVSPTLPLFDILITLINRSLVRQMPGDEPTFRLFPTLQEYGLEELTQAGTLPTLRWQHAHSYRQWAEAAEQGFRTAEQAHWHQQSALAESNLLAALNWLFSDPNNAEAACEGALLASALERFFLLRGRVAEGVAWLEKGLLYRQHMPISKQIALLNKVGSMAQWLGDYTRAEQCHTEALDLSRQSDDELMVAFTLHFLGNVNGRQGNYAAAYNQLSESLTSHRRLPDIEPARLTPLLNNMGIVCLRLDKLEQAMALLAEAVALRRTMNDRLGLASNLGNLGNLALRQGQHQQAAAHFNESLTIRWELQDKPGLLFSLGHVADWAAAQGRGETAVRLYAAVSAQRLQFNIPATADVQSDQDRNLSQLRVTLPESTFNQIWSEGEALSLEEAVKEALLVVETQS